MLLQEAIYKTLAFFDVFDFPLSAFEIYKYLYSSEVVSYDEVWSALAAMEQGKVIHRKNALYMLPGRESIYHIRHDRYLIAEKKYTIALKNAYLLSKIPYIRCICVCNSLAFSSATAESDIDLFIITADRRLWTTRFFAAGMMASLGRRPTPRTGKDTMCLSFFLSDKHQDLSNIALQPYDIYLEYWLATLVPIMNRGQSYERFIADNGWMRQKLANWHPYRVVDRRVVRVTDHSRRGYQSFFLESQFERLQRYLFPPQIEEALRSGIARADATMIKLYLKERRKQYREGFEQRVKGLSTI